ncbi:MAG: AbrB/MazE/SpoVT family DNA-binding domain-containing protein [Sphingomonadaceae bacterium]
MSGMIQSRLTAKAQTTIPRAVRQALGVRPGDSLAYSIEDGRVVLHKAPVPDERAGIADFSTFTEWADALDAVYDRR